MRMRNKHFTLWQNEREVELFSGETGQRMNLTNEQFRELLRFLGPLVETVYPPPASARS